MKASLARIEYDEIQEPVIYLQHFITDLNRSRSVNWVHLNSPGSAGGYAQYVLTNDQSITIQIFLSTYSSNMEGFDKQYGILPELSNYELLAMPSAELFMTDNSQFIQPPLVLLTIGPRQWRCTLESYDVKEDEFNEYHYPTKATVDLSLKTTHGTFESLRAEIGSYLGWRYVAEGDPLFTNEN